MFFIIGAMKAGTTSLFEHLAQHPELCASRHKEPRFFLKTQPTESDEAGYLDQFALQHSGAWCFEASTGYSKFPMQSGVAERIHRRYPDARLIYVLRDPVQRIYSQYLHSFAHGRERLRFGEAVRRDESYLNISRYFLQTAEYLKWFRRDQILIFAMEEFAQDKVGVLRRVFEFLEVDAGFHVPNLDTVYHATEQRTMLPPWLQRIEFISSPWTRRLKKLPLAGAVFRRLGGLLSVVRRPPPKKDEIRDLAAERWIRLQLADDLGRLEEWLGRDFSAWEGDA